MNARDWALTQILQSKLPGWDELKAPEFRGPTDPRDTALGNAIAATVTQNLLQLRHLIKHYSGREVKDIEPMIQVVLAIALAQLRFFDRVPPSAAVDQAVEQIRRVGLTRAAGFVNAVLRRATRELNPPLPGEDNPQQFAHLVLSHPPHVYKKLAHLYGPPQALRICRMHNGVAPIILRLIGSATIDQLKTAITREGGGEITFTPHEVPGLLVVANAVENDFAVWANAGLAQVQDPTSAKVAAAVDVSPGMRVLDRCCGVGTKTMQLAEKLGNTGEIVAIDPAKDRISRLATSARHRGLPNIKPVVAGMLADLGDAGQFDRVLIDAPCSNSGVMGRRIEARYHQDARSMHSLRDLQRRILADTLPAVKPGGQLVYSTCSIWPEENGDQVAWLTAQNDAFEVVTVQTTAPAVTDDPTKHHDGGYYAVLRRKA